MTRTETHISKIRNGQQFVLSPKGRKVFTAYNSPKYADAQGNYSVRIGHQESMIVMGTEPTVYVIK